MSKELEKMAAEIEDEHLKKITTYECLKLELKEQAKMMEVYAKTKDKFNRGYFEGKAEAFILAAECLENFSTDALYD